MSQLVLGLFKALDADYEVEFYRDRNFIVIKVTDRTNPKILQMRRVLDSSLLIANKNSIDSIISDEINFCVCQIAAVKKAK